MKAAPPASWRWVRRSSSCPLRPRPRRSMWSVFEDHNALVRTTPAKRQQTLERDPPAPRRRHAAHRGQVERGRARCRARARKPVFDAIEPGCVPGLRSLRRPRSCAHGRSACGSSSRSPATPRAGPRRAAAAAASPPPTGRSVPASTGASPPRSRGATRALRRPARGALLHDLERAEPPQLPEAHVGSAGVCTGRWSTPRCR